MCTLYSYFVFFLSTFLTCLLLTTITCFSFMKRSKKNISLLNIYKFNKKGFSVGLLRAIKRVISVNMLKSKRTVRALQDSSCKFITLTTLIGDWTSTTLASCICCARGIIQPGQACSTHLMQPKNLNS